MSEEEFVYRSRVIYNIGTKSEFSSYDEWISCYDDVLKDVQILCNRFWPPETFEVTIQRKKGAIIEQQIFDGWVFLEKE